MARLKKETVFPLVKGVLAGELTRAEFYELTNLRPGGYEYWSRKFRSAGPDKSSFVSVKTDKLEDMNGQIEVILALGVRVKFSKMVPAQYLRDLAGLS